MAEKAHYIDVQTSKGTFKVWVEKHGDNPDCKILLLHGGPGSSHDYMKLCEPYFDKAGYEFYYYDQLGSHRSDKPKDDSLWELPRFVDEVEQVRLALGLDKTNFILMGQSWGGLLAMEYAIHHQAALKGMIISNMMSSVPAYGAYSKVLAESSMPDDVYKEIMQLDAAEDYENPRFMELLIPNYYEKHVMRIPFDSWPECVMDAFNRINHDIYIPMQGPSEFGVKGKLADWDRSQDLKDIQTPTLVIGGEHDTMDPKHLAWMAEQLPHGVHKECKGGSHITMGDAPESYFKAINDFLSHL
ncbi:proline iminopeptidase-family hydrolase [Parashewanella tropica]|uniref:proline iminopeptidase-family hydrolase n=1 Tax=Parashewanella tropica TaxID=2547970 RepID=UPI001059FFD0|nr:proline iminopeptidase-family hydrolase [Parashewanella tropica]